jgi:hypothetical protein
VPDIWGNTLERLYYDVLYSQTFLNVLGRVLKTIRCTFCNIFNLRFSEKIFKILRFLLKIFFLNANFPKMKCYKRVMKNHSKEVNTYFIVTYEWAQ